MPEELTLVFEIDGGTAIYMHSIDASEAVRLGDYTYAPPGGQEPSEEVKASAMARARGVTSTPHPELQSAEERKATRAAANEAASQQLTALPLGTPVLVQPHTTTAASPTAAPTAHAEAGAPRIGRRGE